MIILEISSVCGNPGKVRKIAVRETRHTILYEFLASPLGLRVSHLAQFNIVEIIPSPYQKIVMNDAHLCVPFILCFIIPSYKCMDAKRAIQTHPRQ
jgi:hypothetical protein